MRRRILRPLWSRAGLICALVCASACVREKGVSSTAAQQASQRLAALRQVVGDRTVRWIAESELCVVPFDEPTIPQCVARPRRPIPAAEVREFRRTLAAPEGAVADLACVRLSRLIREGDSTLVVVAMTGDAEADGLVESRSQWVWFPREWRSGPGWLITDPDRGTSDTHRMTDAARC